MEFVSQALAGFTAMSYWEYLAVLFGVGYIVFAMKESLWAWPCAFFNTLIYMVLFWNGALLMESALNFYYLLMAFYGFYCWKNNSISTSESQSLPITSWAMSKHLTIIGFTALVSLILGYVMDNYTHADFPYLDTATSCFAVVTTYLVAKKVLENWLYWVVIDAVSIYLFLAKGYYPTVVLFVLYTGLAIAGYFTWRNHYQGRYQFAHTH